MDEWPEEGLLTMGHSQNSPQIVRGRLRELQAVRLRIEGLTYREIGEDLGCSEDGARKAVKRAMDRNRERLAETVQEHTELDLARIERLLATLWPKAETGNLRAVGQIERLLARKAKLLGLDAPERLKVSGDGDEPLVFKVKFPDQE